ncbi:hypothetical protein AKO1_004628 [Acrasis kona]|uniref:Calcineurin-like phosphoesterase domain-containing protein n=1 Tax=Acrasis kona TaxID=1008807 RepID=A0AAW2Z5J5_9EUKA
MVNLNQYQWEVYDRWIHTCQVLGLNEGTKYRFVISAESDGGHYMVKDKTRRFKTLNKSGGVVFASGGDLGAENQVMDIIVAASNSSPDFILIGGDVVYDDGMLSCSSRWYNFLRDYDRVAVTKEGLMIPLLTSIGNHEAKYGLFGSKAIDALPYLVFMNHQIGKYDTDQSLFHSHLLTDKCSLLVLDSGVVNKHKHQVNWMKDMWSGKLSTTKKMAVYHAPLYPSSSDVVDDMVLKGKTHWGPLFSSYNLSIVFENHDHTYSRSKRIYNGQIIQGHDNGYGTVFLGDGAMGVLYPQAIKSPFHQELKIKKHIFIVRCHDDGFEMKAVDDKGVTFDEMSRPNWPSK